MQVINPVGAHSTQVRWPRPVALPIVPVVGEEAIESKDYLRRLGSVLKKMRLAARLTQAVACETIDVDVQTMSRWENGKRAIKLANVAQLVRLYEPDPDNLMLLFDPPPIPVHDLDELLGVSEEERIRGQVRKPRGDG